MSLTDLMDSRALEDRQLPEEIVSLLGELADLIRRVERLSAGAPPATVRELVVEHAATTSELMQRLGLAIHAFTAAQPPEALFAATHQFVTSRVRAWARSSPLFFHVFNTPRDKLGPYEVFDLLLNQRFGGAETASLMFDYYAMRMTVSAAFRLRHQLLTRRLADEISQRALTHRPVRLLNLHMGPGRELLMLARDRALRGMMQVTCVDTDAAGLRRMEPQLKPLLPNRVNFRFGDPRKLVAAKSWPDAPYDIIYALALSDQLSDRQVEPLLAGCHRGLRPGGILIFGNFADSMPAGEHALLRWVFNLNIRRRGVETLQQIFAHTPFGAQALSSELDRYGASWLITAEKV